MPLGPFRPSYGYLNVTGATTMSAFVSGSVSYFSPPTNALAFILESESLNAANIRYALGAVASTLAPGLLLEPGRDTGVIPAGLTLSVISTTSATMTIDLIWLTGG